MRQKPGARESHGENVVISTAPGTSIVLEGISLGDLDANDFYFQIVGAGFSPFRLSSSLAPKMEYLAVRADSSSAPSFLNLKLNAGEDSSIREQKKLRLHSFFQMGPIY